MRFSTVERGDLVWICDGIRYWLQSPFMYCYVLPPMDQYRLYSTLGCHLCEQAQSLLDSLDQTHKILWEFVEIADSDVLLECYGVRIPVLQSCRTGAELSWPFDLDQLLNFIGCSVVSYIKQ